MKVAVLARLVEIDSGRSVALSDDGMSAGGPGSDLEVVDVEGGLAFIDPIAEGFVVTDAGFGVVTVNGAPVIGQRLAQVGDEVGLGRARFRIEVEASEVEAPVAQLAETVTADVPAIVMAPTEGAVIMSDAVEVAEGSTPDGEPTPVPALSSRRQEGRAPRVAMPAPVDASSRRMTWRRTVLGWVLVLMVVVGSGIAGYLVAAMLRGGR